MTHFSERPPDSLEYTVGVAESAGMHLRAQVLAIAKGERPPLQVRIKFGGPGNKASRVTDLDDASSNRILNDYRNTTTLVLGEEGSSKQSGRVITLTVHADPIDGTDNFIEFVAAVTKWLNADPATRGPKPISGAGVSLGGVDTGGAPKLGAVTIPFLEPDGLVTWAAETGGMAMRKEPDGRWHRLPHASERTIRGMGAILVSQGTAKHNALALQDAGFEVVVYDAFVAAGLCVLDPTLFARLIPDIQRLNPGVDLSRLQISAIYMHSPGDWDVAALDAIAANLGMFSANMRGDARRYEQNDEGFVLAVSEQLGRAALGAVQQRNV